MADGPGGKEVGRIYVRVLPNTDRFAKELKAKLQELERTLKVDLPVSVDTDRVKAELTKVKKQAEKGKIKLDAEVDGDGVVRETRRIKQLAQKAVGAIGLTMDVNMKATLAKIRAQMAVINKVVKGYKIKIPIDLVSWARLLFYATAIGGALLSIPHILAAIGGAVKVVGGLLATLPAIAAGAAIGISTLVVGMQGFFKTLSSAGDAAEFEKNLKNLTPSAQSAARALAEFREPLSEIRKSVQERLFEGMDESFRSLKALLPQIKTGMTGTAGAMRQMFQEWIKMATTQSSQDDLTRIFFNTTQGLKAMKPVLANIGSALKDFAVVGSSFFTEWGAGLSDATNRFKEWSAEARKSGEMREWIDNAIAKIAQLGRVINDLWVGFSNITTALRNGESFGDMMERISQSFRDWTANEDTQNAFRQIGDAIRYVVQIGADVFQKLFSEIGRILEASMPFIKEFVRVLGVVLSAAIDAVGPKLQQFGRWLSENRQWVAPLAVALLGLVTAFKLAVTAANGIKAVKESFQALKAAGGIIGDVIGAMGRFVKSMAINTAKVVMFLGRQIAAFYKWMLAAAKSAAFTARYYAIMAAQAIARSAQMAAAVIARWAQMAAAAVANAVRVTAAWLATYTRIAVAALASALRMAAAWVIAMGPIGWVIAAIVALVVLIVSNWDSIKAKTVAIWNNIWGFITKLVNDIKDWIVTRFNDVVDFFKRMGGWISEALGDLWDIITGPFEGPINTVKGWIADLGSAWDNLMGNIQGNLKAGRWQQDFKNNFGREKGGPVNSGVTYTANEAGPEMYSTMSGKNFLMAGGMGSFTPPVTGSITPNKDLRNSLISLGSGGSSGGGDSSIADALVSRVLEAMSNWSWDIQFDPNGVAKMVNKTNLMNRRRG